MISSQPASFALSMLLMQISKSMLVSYVTTALGPCTYVMRFMDFLLCNHACNKWKWSGVITSLQLPAAHVRGQGVVDQEFRG